MGLWNNANLNSAKRPGTGSLTFTADGTLTVPQGLWAGNARAWGASGASSGCGSLTNGRGSGGGAFAGDAALPLIPDEVLTISIGTPGVPDGIAGNASIGGDGGPTTLSRGGTPILRAAGGKGGQGAAAGNFGGPGGAVADSIGATLYRGGNGAPTNCGGGGSAGAGGQGGDAPNSATGGAAGTGEGGTAGATGTTVPVDGTPPGGGSSGKQSGGATSVGGSGARGELRISW